MPDLLHSLEAWCNRQVQVVVCLVAEPQHLPQAQCPVVLGEVQSLAFLAQVLAQHHAQELLQDLVFRQCQAQCIQVVSQQVRVLV